MGAEAVVAKLAADGSLACSADVRATESTSDASPVVIGEETKSRLLPLAAPPSRAHLTASCPKGTPEAKLSLEEMYFICSAVGPVRGYVKSVRSVVCVSGGEMSEWREIMDGLPSIIPSRDVERAKLMEEGLLESSEDEEGDARCASTCVRDLGLSRLGWWWWEDADRREPAESARACIEWLPDMRLSMLRIPNRCCAGVGGADVAGDVWS